uniref:Reverse transcriptase domain-containing protein n=1 Tax=Tanacetum cinerariifolium TaxID=118510 RepID=A0A699GH43_TANCI|nr:hypothetical protein [Tanacetum cinerariifolium]
MLFSAGLLQSDVYIHHPITILSDYDIEDAFSSTNTSDYTLASSDYFPALPGKTSLDPSEDLSKYLLASLAISPFHDDPYIKVMQAYDATKILPSQKRARFLSSSSIDSSTPPQRDFDQLETELQEACTEIFGFQIEQIRHDDEIVLARVMIYTIEMIIEDIQVCHQSDMKSLMDKIRELKNHKEGPPGY